MAASAEQLDLPPEIAGDRPRTRGSRQSVDLNQRMQQKGGILLFLYALPILSVMRHNFPGATGADLVKRKERRRPCVDVQICGGETRRGPQRVWSKDKKYGLCVLLFFPPGRSG